MPNPGWALVLAAGTLSLGPGDGPRESASTHSAVIDTLEARVAAGLRPVSMGRIICGKNVERLKRQGLTDPVSAIVDSLVAHPEIIPSGTPSQGRAGFCWREGIHVLDRSWVYATFTDGHFEGRGLFEYAVRADSSIAFRLIRWDSDMGPD